MNAIIKAAWFELVVSILALAGVTAFHPWLGNGAVGAFGILGLLGGAYWFLRRCGTGVVVLAADYRGTKQVALSLMVWLVFLQSAICYGVMGLVGVVSHRRQSRAA